MRKNTITTTLLGLLALALPAAADQNLVIVSIGDSLAAGEGNPDNYNGIPGDAGWLSASCHQSVNNGRRFASNRINNLPGVSTEFFDFSCSGAAVEAGLLGTQQTSQPFVNNFNVPAQLSRVAEFQHSSTGLNGRPIDILMISVGVNDANFAPVVSACLTSPGDCSTTTLVKNAVNFIPAKLPALYDSLTKAIHDNLNVKHVYFTEYPDEMTSVPMDFCGDLTDNGTGDGTMLGGSPTENAFLFQNFLQPLNGQITAAVSRAATQFPTIAWRTVTGPLNTFSTHGYCTPSSRRYVNTVADSIARQGDPNGSMHPNIAGHQAYADALIARATLDFNLALENPRIVRRVETNVGLPVPPLFLPNPVAPFVKKAVQVEIGQHVGTLSVTLLSRIRTSGSAAPAFTTTPMVRTSSGLPNEFVAEIPGSETAPGLNIFAPDWVEYQVKVTATLNGETATTQTSTKTISYTVGSLLAQ